MHDVPKPVTALRAVAVGQTCLVSKADSTASMQCQRKRNRQKEGSVLCEPDHAPMGLRHSQ